jgi:hypothetical protein
VGGDTRQYSVQNYHVLEKKGMCPLPSRCRRSERRIPWDASPAPPLTPLLRAYGMVSR